MKCMETTNLSGVNSLGRPCVSVTMSCLLLLILRHLSAFMLAGHWRKVVAAHECAHDWREALSAAFRAELLQAELDDLYRRLIGSLTFNRDDLSTNNLSVR